MQPPTSNPPAAPVHTIGDLLAWVRAFPTATPHPLMPWFTPEQMVACLQKPGGEEELVTLYREREHYVRAGLDEEYKDFDPYRFGWDLPHWLEADLALKRAASGRAGGQYVGGGKRSTKSERAARRLVQAAMHLPGLVAWALTDNLTTSKATQMPLVWKYLPREIKALNGRTRHGKAKINYSIDGGFTEGVLVLPNASNIWFLPYEAKPTGYEGWELGAKLKPVHLNLLRQWPWLLNVGAWMDENCPLPWLETVMTRTATRNAVWLWTYSTREGITAAIKWLIGAPKTIRSKPAPLLAPHRRHVDDCPEGQMPLEARPARENVSVMYFHTDLNPFPPNYENMARLAQSATEEWIKENLYGHSSEQRGRVWPAFSQVHILDDPADLPADRTNFMVFDAATARNCCALWVGVTPGNPETYTIFRDWPDAQTYGDWAVPSDNPNQPDGDAGPAQRALGYGPSQYKNTFLDLELIPCSAGAPLEADPYRRKLQLANPGEDPPLVREEIFRRYMDPRAARNEHVVKRGGTCLLDLYGEEDRDPQTGALFAPRMSFLPAAGLDIHEGVAQVAALLWWDKQLPLVWPTNAPRLYVGRWCRQVIWALLNYTALGGEKGGCKDFADLLRYMATSRLRYMAPGPAVTRGGMRAGAGADYGR